jgi:hypothetical protein
MVAGTGLAGNKVAFEQVDVFVVGERDYKEFRVPVLVVTNSGTLLAISEAGRIRFLPRTLAPIIPFIVASSDTNSSLP